MTLEMATLMARVSEMRDKKLSWRQIEIETGKDHRWLIKTYRRAVLSTMREPIRALRESEQRSLDDLWARLYLKFRDAEKVYNLANEVLAQSELQDKERVEAARGDRARSLRDMVNLHEQLVKNSARRSKLLGLDAADRIEIQGNVNLMVSDREQRVSRAILADAGLTADFAKLFERAVLGLPLPSGPGDVGGRTILEAGEASASLEPEADGRGGGEDQAALGDDAARAREDVDDIALLPDMVSGEVPEGEDPADQL